MTQPFMAVVMILLSATTAFAQDVSPVKLGLILDMSSIYADVGGPGSVQAARMAAEDFGGKVLGRPIEVQFVDHQNKPEIAAAAAARWLDVEHVSAILDVASSSPALAVMNVARTRNAIVLLNGPGASSITNEQCMPTAIHWAYNTYALGKIAGSAIVEGGGKSWYFLTADYTFGAQLQADTSSVVEAAGGAIVGSVKVPIGTTDFSSFLLQAQQSHAQVVAFANSGADLDNAAKQAGDFGLVQGGQKLVGLLTYINDVHALGLEAAHGLMLAGAFYWDMNDETRAFSKRYFARTNRMPNMSQAGIYSSTLHYLDAVQAAGTLDTQTVLTKMRETPVNDVFTHSGHIRPDGLMAHDMYLFQVKTPAESKGEWDLYNLIATIKADDAFLPLSKSRCPSIKH